MLQVVLDFNFVTRNCVFEKRIILIRIEKVLFKNKEKSIYIQTNK